MVETGLCWPTYPGALCVREKESPTGLDMGGFGVAIPHTDASHVRYPGIAIAVPRVPVTFTHMGSDDPVEARIVCAIAIDEPGAHLDFVEALLALMRDTETLVNLAAARTPGELMEIIRAKEAADAAKAKEQAEAAKAKGQAEATKAKGQAESAKGKEQSKGQGEATKAKEQAKGQADAAKAKEQAEAPKA
jgi:PTS system galactitol-specific IIA component